MSVNMQEINLEFWIMGRTTEGANELVVFQDRLKLKKILRETPPAG